MTRSIFSQAHRYPAVSQCSRIYIYAALCSPWMSCVCKNLKRFFTNRRGLSLVGRCV